eukprot:4935505-Amphidinium_carterae.2
MNEVLSINSTESTSQNDGSVQITVLLKPLRNKVHTDSLDHVFFTPLAASTKGIHKVYSGPVAAQESWIANLFLTRVLVAQMLREQLSQLGDRVVLIHVCSVEVSHRLAEWNSTDRRSICAIILDLSRRGRISRSKYWQWRFEAHRKSHSQKF